VTAGPRVPPFALKEAALSVDITSRTAHIFLSCGEASGDRYGAALVAALRRINPDLRFSALGGQGLAAAGVEIVQSSAPLSVMGFGEVIGALPRIVAARRKLNRRLAVGDIDIFLPIDFPGFNMSLARNARRRGIPVFYLIAPQLWAWAGWRIGSLRRSIDRLGVVLPFEKKFFAERGIDVVDLGHPLVEDYPRETVVRDRRYREMRLADDTAPLTIGLLPGSRRQELTRLLGVFLESIELMRGLTDRRLEILVSAAPGADRELLEPARNLGCSIVEQPLPRLMPRLDLALVCSGTASLETALAGVPHSVVYRTSAFNYVIGRHLVKVDRIGLANLVLGEDVTPEYIQGEAKPAVLAADLVDWLKEDRRRTLFGDRVDRLRAKLGGEGFWDRTAAAVAEFAAGPGTES